MIRRILFFAALIFTVAWFAVAHLIKSRAILIGQTLGSDNTKISYDEVRVVGFPGLWTIHVTNPTIKFIDHLNSKEISTKSANIIFDLSQKKATLNCGKEFIAQKNSTNNTIEYSARASKDIEATIKLSKPLYKVTSTDALSSIIKSVSLNHQQLEVAEGDKIIFSISDMNVALAKSFINEHENIAVKFRAFYDSPTQYLNFSTANLEFDTTLSQSLLPAAKDGERFEKDFNINQFHLVFDDAKINLKGMIHFLPGRLPEGKFEVVVDNYHNVIDKLVPSNFLISKALLKKIIAKASNTNLDDDSDLILVNADPDARFDLEFSDEGIKIGKINLFNFNGDE